MKNKPTQSDVAKLAGVSRATVSYVINNRQAENAIPDETTERVLAAIRELGYVPNQQAQHLKRQATNRICVIMARLGIPANDLMIQGLRTHFAQKNYSIIIAVGDNHSRIMQLITQIKGGLADGVYLDLGYGAIRNIDIILEQLKGINVPMMIDAPIEPTNDYDVTWVTDIEGTYEAVQYLIDKGHQQIAFIGHNIAEIENYGRYRGYVKALTDNNISIRPEYIHVGLEQREQTYNAVNALLKVEQRPTAIFCTSDINALTTMAVIQHHGLSIPQDIAVIGFGNISESQFTYPRLTTVGPAQHTFDTAATLMLHRLMDKDQKPPQKIINQWNLIIREST